MTLEFDKNNLYLGLKRTIYKTQPYKGICIRDRFGSVDVRNNT